MKILMTSSFYASHGGGLEIVAGELYRGFARSGTDVAWLAGDVTPPPEPCGDSYAVPIRIWNFVEKKTGIPFPIPLVSAIKKIVREVRKADAVVLHDCLYLDNIMAYLTAKFYGRPVLVIQHIGAFPSSSLFVRLVVRFGTATITSHILSKSDQTVFISETTREYFSFIKFKNCPKVIFNGVDTSVFHPRHTNAQVGDLRERFGLRKDQTVILFAGRFVEKKGITIMRWMVEKRPEWIWAFAGWGPTDPSRWNAANARVFSHLDRQSIAELYRACDLLVLPSVGEGFPLVIQEALCSGLPVVCSVDTVGADPKIAEFVTGAGIFPGEDERTAAGFLAAIEEVLATNNLNMSSEVPTRTEFAARRYSWDAAVRQYQEVLSNLMQSARYAKRSGGNAS